ncbi:MAG: ABC transporter ATP-binding protein [Pseudomonadota bacterium]
MSSEVAIEIDHISKHYMIYDRPEDRLKQMLLPKLHRMVGVAGKKYYREFAAVENVNLKVMRGETVGIVGGNGSGKSTLLQLVCGTLHPTAGYIKVRGRIAALLELGSGFNPDFTGRENVYMNASILGLSQRETQDRFEQIAEFADIGHFIEQPTKTYSSGMNVRLAFAVATNVDPDILIVDEALSVGDEAFQRKCFARIEQIKERGGTILFVSHSAQTVTQLCDRALLMDRGEGILLGEPKSVIKQYQRLLGLDSDAKNKARAEIKAAGTTDRLAKTESVSRQIEPPTGPVDEAWFDPTLQSSSAVEYGDNSAKISDVHITRTNGTRVNVLTKGIDYDIRYTVDFIEAAGLVAFGTMLKTINGIELGGIGTNLRQEYVEITSSGQSVEVRMRFKCALQAGTYFCNAGVTADTENGLSYLHRLVDAVCFRVVGDVSSDFSGAVDFKIEHELTLFEPKSNPSHAVAS